jgi:hypothetical protein
MVQQEAEDEEPDADVQPIVEQSRHEDEDFGGYIEEVAPAEDGRVPGAPLL